MISRLFYCLIISALFSCKAKTPYNPYLKAKEKPSTEVAKEHKRAKKEAIKSGKKQLRKNRKNVYAK